MGIIGRSRPPRFTFGNAESITSGRNRMRRSARSADGTSLTAAGFRVTKNDADTLRRLIQPWQSRSFAYYDLLGEIKYAAQFYSRSLSQLRLYAAEIDDNGDLKETENPVAIDALARIQDPGGGRSQLLGQYGRLMFLVGESLLFVSENRENEMEQWEMLSTDELRVMAGTYMRYKAPSLPAEDLRFTPTDDDYAEVTDDTAVAYRIWQRHPRYSMLADCTMQGVLDLCEELVILTRAVRARARSRLAGSGILAIDERLTQVGATTGPDEDPQEDPFISVLTEAMTAPIADEGSASAVVPMVIRGGVPDGMSIKDMISHIQIIDPTQLYPETGLRTECIHRIAIGLDMPPEILEGMEDSNHWSAWQVDEQSWKAHLQPKAQQLVDDLTSAYFRPALKAAGEDWMRYCIGYDATAVINHPDRVKDAKEFYDRRAIGKKALRDAGGFTDDDAPTKDELAEMIGVTVRDASLAWYGIPSVKAGGIEPVPGEIVAPGDTGGDAETGAQTGAEVEQGPPPDGPPDETTITGGANGNGNVNGRKAQLQTASDLAVLRAREVAGSRLRTHVRRLKDAEAERLIDGVRASDVAATLGHERVRALKAPAERELVVGSRPLIEDALRMWGLDKDEALAQLIATNVEEHAARTLYDLHPAPLPSSFTNHLASLVTKK